MKLTTDVPSALTVMFWAFGVSNPAHVTFCVVTVIVESASAVNVSITWDGVVGYVKSKFCL